VKSGLNFARFCDPKLDGLISQGKALSEQDKRSALYHDAQQLIHDQALWLPLAHPTASVLLRKEVKGYAVNPFGRQDFSKVSL
jgi:peptide/nickel transport system substrate-binding protein